MSAPTTPTVRSTLVTAVRQAVVDLGGPLGRSVYVEGALDNPKAPYAVISDAPATDALSGDGGTQQQQRPVVITVYQANARDADPRIAHDLAEHLHGRTVLVGRTSDDARRVFLRCRGAVDTIATEGLREQEITVRCYGPPTP